jgi:cytochrome c biogenesis protein CcmG, thiol:disulfide interchange protein DsbE
VELPRVEELYKKYRGRGFSVVAVEAARDTDRALKVIEEKGLTFNLLETEEDNDVVDDVFSVRGFPTVFMIDRNGKIVYSHLGFEDGDEARLEQEILALLAK